jgi:hypothetical protein
MREILVNLQVYEFLSCSGGGAMVSFSQMSRYLSMLLQRRCRPHREQRSLQQGCAGLLEHRSRATFENRDVWDLLEHRSRVTFANGGVWDLLEQAQLAIGP